MFPINTYPTAVSIASGVGITDRCLAEAGFKILVANDINSNSKETYIYNHQYQDKNNDPDFVEGDFCKAETAEKIIKLAKKKLGNTQLDLLTAFGLSKANNVQAFQLFFNNVFKVCHELSAKIVIIDQAKGIGKKIVEEFNKYKFNNTAFNYEIINKKYSLVKHRVPNSTKRNITFLFNKNIFQNQQLSAPILDEHPPISIKQALKCVWSDIDTGNKSHNRIIPLHINPVQFNETDQIKLIDLLEPIAQGQFIPKDRLRDNFNRALRAFENSPYPRNLSARAITGPFHSIHPLFHRGYTPFELVLLSTLSDIPFELAPKNKEEFSKIFNIIADTTPPRFLIPLFKKACALATGQAGPKPLKLKNSFHSITHDDELYYTGSYFHPRPSQRKLSTLLADNASKTYWIYGYRKYLYELICNNLHSLTQKYPNTPYFKDLQSILTFKLNKQVDSNQKSIPNTLSLYQIATTNLLKVFKLFTYVKPEVLEDPVFLETLNSFTKPGHIFNVSIDSKKQSFSNYLLRTPGYSFSKYSKAIQPYLRDKIEFRCPTVLSFAEWKSKNGIEEDAPMDIDSTASSSPISDAVSSESADKHIPQSDTTSTEETRNTTPRKSKKRKRTEEGSDLNMSSTEESHRPPKRKKIISPNHNTSSEPAILISPNQQVILRTPLNITPVTIPISLPLNPNRPSAFNCISLPLNPNRPSAFTPYPHYRISNPTLPSTYALPGTIPTSVNLTDLRTDTVLIRQLDQESSSLTQMINTPEASHEDFELYGYKSQATNQ